MSGYTANTNASVYTYKNNAKMYIYIYTNIDICDLKM